MCVIADTLRSHANVLNLIVDVRDNPGGDAGCEAKMVQWFLTESGPSNFTYQKVMSNTTYPCFTNCFNWPAAIQPFEEFVKVDGMEGFYNRDISNELKIAIVIGTGTWGEVLCQGSVGILQTFVDGDVMRHLVDAAVVDIEGSHGDRHLGMGECPHEHQLRYLSPRLLA